MHPEGKGYIKLQQAEKYIGFTVLIFMPYLLMHRGHAMAQLVEALRYKPEGRGFDSQWCHWHNPCGRTLALGSTQPVTKMSNRNISWGVKAAGA
jgi:hypothetical protein